MIGIHLLFNHITYNSSNEFILVSRSNEVVSFQERQLHIETHLERYFLAGEKLPIHRADGLRSNPLRFPKDNRNIYIILRTFFRQMTNAMSCDVSTILCGLEIIILGSALWLLTVLFQIWMPRPFTLALATIGTALWLVGVVNICTMLVPILCTPSRDLTDNS